MRSVLGTVPRLLSISPSWDAGAEALQPEEANRVLSLFSENSAHNIPLFRLRDRHPLADPGIRPIKLNPTGLATRLLTSRSLGSALET